MNDDFLYRLRKEPSQAFAARLKLRLKLQASQSERRRSIVRALILSFLVGGSALAATLWVVEGMGLREMRASMGQAKDSTIQASGTTRQSAADSPVHATGSPFARSLDSHGAARIADASIRTQPPTQPASNGVDIQEGAPINGSGSRAEIVGSSRNSVFPRPLHVMGSATALQLAHTAQPKGLPALQMDIEYDDEAFRRLCERFAEDTPDVIVTTRRMTREELSRCKQMRDNAILEAKIAYAAVVIAAAPTASIPRLTPQHLYLAIAKQIPDRANPERFIPNPNLSWHQVHPGYEQRSITVFGPAPDSSLARAWGEVVMEQGCNTFPTINALKTVDPERHRRLCHEIRDDSVYVPIAESHVFITQQLWADPNAIAVLSFALFHECREELSSSLLTGETATRVTIGSGAYSGSTPLYVYSSEQRLKYARGLSSFLDDLLSARTISPRGYFVGTALVPLDESQHPVRMQQPEQFED